MLERGVRVVALMVMVRVIVILRLKVTVTKIVIITELKLSTHRPSQSVHPIKSLPSTRGICIQFRRIYIVYCTHPCIHGVR